MTSLKEQTVYIPVDRQKISEVPLFYVSEFKDKDWHYLSHTEKKENQICLSKDELIELLGKTFDQGMRKQRACGTDIEEETPNKEQFINNLLNQ